MRVLNSTGKDDLDNQEYVPYCLWTFWILALAWTWVLKEAVSSLVYLSQKAHCPFLEHRLPYENYLPIYV